MFSSRIHRIPIAIATLAFAVVATAQETPPADPQEEKEPPVAKRWWIDVGFTGKGSGSGNVHRFNQYGTIPDGVFIKDFGLATATSPSGHQLRFSVRGEPTGDATGEFGFVYGGRIVGRASGSLTHFFDPTPILIEESQRRSLSGDVSYALTPKLSAYGRFSETRQTQNYEPPKVGVSDRTKQVVAGISGNLLGGETELLYSNHRYLDRTGENPNATRRTLFGSYHVQASPNVFLGGSFSQTNIEQNFRYDSKVTQWSLDGSVQVADNAFLSFYGKRTSYELPNAENNFVRKRFEAGANFNLNEGSGRFQFGFRHRELERYRDEFDFVDVPAYNQLSARWSSKIGDGLRYAIRGSWENVESPPQVVGGDERQLIFDDRIRGQLRVEKNCERLTAYGVYDFSYDQNKRRSVEVLGHTLTFGGTLLVNDSTSAFVEIASETFNAKHGPSEAGPTLDQFFPSGVTLSAGADWTLGPTSSLSLWASRFFARNDNPLLVEGGNVRTTQITLQYFRQLSENNRLEVAVSPWNYTDKAYGLGDYKATLFSISFGTKF